MRPLSNITIATVVLEVRKLENPNSIRSRYGALFDRLFGLAA